jgi:hypothetical protein
MLNQSFLLNKAHDVSTGGNESWEYDNELQINTIFVDDNGKATPVCTISSMVTQSKTAAFPGDDDPDRDAELMY